MTSTALSKERVSPPPPPYEPNAILRWLYARFFAHIRIDEKWSRNVREASEQGVVVYVMRSLSFLDFLCLDFLLKRFGLPLIRFANDLGLWILEPFGKGERRLSLRRQIPEKEALAATLQESFSALLFLRRPPRFGRRSRRGEALPTDLIESLIRLQRKRQAPILLVPQTFVWSKRPGSAQGGAVDSFFGPVQWPGRLRVLVQFVLNYRNALLRSGEPFNLKEFVDTHRHLDDCEIADKVSYALLSRIERERALVLGPLAKSSWRIQEELLRSPRVRTHIHQEVQRTQQSLAKVEAQARKELRHLCAKQSPFVLGLAYRLLHRLWNRMYDGLVVDREGVERIRNAARDGAVVLLPSHKSHIDYLVLSYVLYAHQIRPPLIAAGENLSFWPLGPILRRGGAFFIRRSFQGKKLYASLVDAYMRKLLVEGFPIEFFLEGGRSRSGKLLPPKHGLLSMIVDAALLLKARKVHFVPVSIGYERIIEERSFVHELSGGEKQSENMSDLIRSSSVLRSKWGRLYVEFGEIIAFDDLIEETLGEASNKDQARESLSPAQRRNLVQTLAQRVMLSINSVTVTTPAALVATALLNHPRRGMTRDELFKASASVHNALQVTGASIASQIKTPSGQLREDTLNEAIQLFVDAKLLLEHTTGPEPIYTIPSERRIALEYYQNTIIHFFIPRAFIYTALSVDRPDAISLERLRDRVRRLSELFKHEFAFHAEIDFGAAFEYMLASGEIERQGDQIRLTDAEDAFERYTSMLRPFFESYLLALRGAALILERPIPKKDWFKKTLAIGQQMFLAGEIERRESISKLKLENALLSLIDYKIVERQSDDLLTTGTAFQNIEDLHALEPQLRVFLR